MNTHVKTIILVLGVVVGIIVGEKSVYASEVFIFACALFVLQLGVYFYERKKRSDAEGVASNILVSLFTILCALGLIIGIIRAQLVEEKVRFVCEQVCTFSAKIISSPEIKNDYQVFVVQPVVDAYEKDEKPILGIQVRVPLYPRYTLGETVLLTGKALVPDTLFPHGENLNRSFDYVTYLSHKKIGSEMMYPKVESIDEDARTITEHLGRWKESLISRGDKYIESPASSLAHGMLFGVTGMSKELTETFRVSGLSHIVVLSGFNIAIVIVAILFVLAFIPLVLRLLLASVSVIIFVLMVGAEPSIVRATLMAFIGLLALALGKEYVARQALIISFLLIILYDPSSLLHSVSLHLSFLATAGIVYLANPISSIVKTYFPIFSRANLQELVVTSVSAYFATLPYVVYIFGTVSVYALIANIVVLPFVPLAMLVSALTIFSSYVSHMLALVFGFVDTILVNTMIFIARTVEGLPYSSLSLSVSLYEMIALYGAIIVSIVYVSSRSKDAVSVRDADGNLTGIIKY